MGYDPRTDYPSNPLVTSEDFLRIERGLEAAHAVDLSKRPNPRHRRLRVVNNFTNPRGVARTKWVAERTTAGSTGVVFDDIADADFGQPGKANTGWCTRHTATYPAGEVAYHSTLWAAPFSTEGVSLPGLAGFSYQVYARARVKIPQGPPQMRVELWITTRNNDGTNNKGTLVDVIDGVAPGEILDLEGWDMSNGGAQRTGAQISISSSKPPVANDPAVATTIESRVGQAVIVVEPATDFPSYGDGTWDEWAWDGTADASTSYGWVETQTWPDDFLFGANENDISMERIEDLDNDQLASLYLDVGANVVRIGSINPNEGIWPQGNADPNWRAVSKYADLFDALRKAGLKAMPIIGGVALWMTTGGQEMPNNPGWGDIRFLDPVRYDDWARLWTSLVDEWPDVIEAVEFWNEPNLDAVWGAAVTIADATTFGNLEKELSTRFKAVHSDVLFVSPALAHVDANAPGYGLGAEDWLGGYYAAGVVGHHDALSVHVYPSNGGSGGANAATTGFLLRVQQQMYLNNDNVPLVFTEIGFDLPAAAFPERAAGASHMLWRGRQIRKGASLHTIHELWAPVQAVVAGRSFAITKPETHQRMLAFYALQRDRLAEADFIPITAFENGWTNSTGNLHDRLAYRLLDDGMIHLRGMVHQPGPSSGGTVITTLPEGLRPPATIYRNAMVFNGASWVAGLLAITGIGAVYVAAGGSNAANNLHIFDFVFPRAR